MIPTGEAVTMATDYLLAATAFAAAMWLWKTAAGAPGPLVGGRPSWPRAWPPSLGRDVPRLRAGARQQTHGLVWRLTYVTVEIANLCMLYGAALAGLPRTPPPRRLPRSLPCVLVVAVGADPPRPVPLRPLRLRDHAASASSAWPPSAGGAAAAGRRLGDRRRGRLRWLGAVVQLGRIGQGRVFNHNDVFHVLQAIGIALYARGGRDLRRAEVPVIR